MFISSSQYLVQNKPFFKKLQQRLSAEYGFAAVLAADGREQTYSVSASGTVISDGNTYGKRGFTVRVYNGKAFAEYSATEISERKIEEIAEIVGNKLAEMAKAFPQYQTELLKDETITFAKSSEYRIHPAELGDEEIVTRLAEIRRYALSLDECLVDCIARLQYQIFHKLYISDNKDLEQNCMLTCGALVVLAARGEELKNSYRGFSGMCGVELLDNMREAVPDRVKTVMELLNSEPLPPGTYDCVCTPEVTGMIVHEAFGHGVEMDMFVKDRALAKSCMGEMVASELVTMRDGAAAANEVASFFFDDEGNLGGDTLIIDHGRLVAGMADAVSASRLGVEPTGNGRRESVERKVYTRMTNTYFEPGSNSVEEMIASISYGLLLDEPTSGMEDPKNWGIQAMVSFGREIKDGQLTGRIFSPIVLSGYVPDLLKSISMMSGKVELLGSGACGKGWKEWVKVSDGGPWIKAKIRLG